MFQGSHPYHIDDKGRLKMPADFARALGAAFIVTRGMEGCLWLLPDTEWRQLVERLRGQTLADPRTRALQRHFIGAAESLSLDGQGRITIPPVLREAAGIRHELMLVGVETRVEVWSRERWDAYQTSLSDEAIEELARGLGI